MLGKIKRKFQEVTDSHKEVAPTVVHKKNHIPFRLNFLFFIVFGLFVALLIQLAYLQLANGQFFNTKIKWDQKTTIKGNAPRGQIYDRNGKVLVENTSKQAVLYTKPKNMSGEKLLETAKKITEIISIDADNVTDRDKKDYWLADPDHLKEAQGRLKKSEKVDAKGNFLSNDVVYQNTLDKVTEAEIDYSKDEEKVISVFKRISGAQEMTPVYVKTDDVTTEEVARVGESMGDIPGLSAGVDWERSYPEDEFLGTILGRVSTEKNGLPAEERNRYVANGYAVNDRVGLSYIEKYYETALKGTKSNLEMKLTEDGQRVESTVEKYPGEKGKNVVLTIEQEFQEKIEDILYRNYGQLMNSGKTQYSEGIYAVVMNPKTGEINALAGINHDLDSGKLSMDALGTINKSFTPGSVVKPATIMAGWRNGVISGNEVLVDEPIQIMGDAVKESVFTNGKSREMTAVEALKDSSNVYMMKIAFKLMGETYSKNMVLGDHTDVFATLRNNYQDFGLGTSTGIDVAGESFGLSTKDYYQPNGTLIQGRMGNLLDLSYGNFDTYTPIQLAQYVSTIANNGVKLAPRIVKGLYSNDPDGKLGGMELATKPKVMAHVGSQDQYDIIHEGMYQVVNEGGSGMWMDGTKYTASAKTGTAEVPKDNPNDPDNPIELYNSTMIAYAPSDDPKVSVSLVIPHISDEADKMNSQVTKEILDAYYDYFEK
ncbi:penicillin-binding protein 2 [Vagococcus coleopterorum]|uniref:Penicillin-binding protein 2 n=1 Tax=Vagococcus coleopterorum TaxID=2714946 RepID=A0A6G8AMS8_9ENTE|nr:penicillin-binding protein 2 [Vagococcus coleopterorum]QIL46269.1 penicillin-binding protein 2 [Vagococcus coleopterorum]